MTKISDMTRYEITANAICSVYEAASEQEAITAFLKDAGYGSVEAAAEVCGQSVDEFMDSISVEALAS